MSDSPHDTLSGLFSESYRALRRYVRRLVDSQEAAEDIVQESFLRIYQHGDKVKTPRALLFSAARNLAIDARRHARIARTDSLGDFDALGIVSAGESPERQVLADERSRLLRKAIGCLPPQCRAVFALRVFHACSYKEIAEHFGISVKTVEKHVARGLRETHACLQRYYRDVKSPHE